MCEKSNATAEIINNQTTTCVCLGKVLSSLRCIYTYIWEFFPHLCSHKNAQSPVQVVWCARKIPSLCSIWFLIFSANAMWLHSFLSATMQAESASWMSGTRRHHLFSMAFEFFPSHSMANICLTCICIVYRYGKKGDCQPHTDTYYTIPPSMYGTHAQIHWIIPIVGWADSIIQLDEVIGKTICNICSIINFLEHHIWLCEWNLRKLKS